MEELLLDGKKIMNISVWPGSNGREKPKKWCRWRTHSSANPYSMAQIATWSDQNKRFCIHIRCRISVHAQGIMHYFFLDFYQSRVCIHICTNGIAPFEHLHQTWIAPQRSKVSATFPQTDNKQRESETETLPLSPTSLKLQPEACHVDRDVSGKNDGDDIGGRGDGWVIGDTTTEFTRCCPTGGVS